MPYSNECQYRYILDAIKKLKDGGYSYLDLKFEVMENWRDAMERRSADSVWNKGGCSSWYVTDKGINTNNWPGPWLEYKRRTKSVKTQEYHFV